MQIEGFHTSSSSSCSSLSHDDAHGTANVVKKRKVSSEKGDSKTAKSLQKTVSCSLLSSPLVSASFSTPRGIIESVSIPDVLRGRTEGVRDFNTAMREFQHVSENPYYDKVAIRIRDRMVEDHENARCRCRERGQDCGPESSCINRGTFTECSESCPVGDKCKNQVLKHKAWKKVSVKPAINDKIGFGLFSEEDIERDEIIIEYCGEVVSAKTARKRLEKFYKSEHHKYMYDLSGEGLDDPSQGLLIDATRIANVARFANHSCDPNAIAHIWTVEGRKLLGISAIRRIPKGEEICTNYSFHRYGSDEVACLCGAENCLGNFHRSAEESFIFDHQRQAGWDPVLKDAIGIPASAEYNQHLFDDILRFNETQRLQGRDRKFAKKGYLFLGNGVQLRFGNMRFEKRIRRLKVRKREGKK